MEHQNFYDLSTADLQRAAVSSDVISRIITQYTQSPNAGAGGGDGLEVAALLAALLKQQVPKNVRFTIYPFTVTVPFDAVLTAAVQQFLPQNLNRKYLYVQRIQGGGKLYLNMNENAVIQTPLTQSAGNVIVRSSIPIDGFGANQTQIPNPTVFSGPAPSNAISLLFDNQFEVADTTFTGLIIEG